VLGIGDVDAHDSSVRMHGTHELQMRAAVEQRMREVGDVRAADREHPWIFGAEHPLSEQRHVGARLPVDVVEE
jgi:hypothetical protein